MANTILSNALIAKEALIQLENQMVLGNLVHRGYEDEFDQKANGYGDNANQWSLDPFQQIRWRGKRDCQNANYHLHRRQRKSERGPLCFPCELHRQQWNCLQHRYADLYHRGQCRDRR